MFLELIPIFLNTFFTLIIFLCVLSFLVIIHELGHFVTAWLAKIQIEEFGLGYPPRAMTLFHWRKVPFTLNWLPLGGFVKMKGEDGPESVNTENTKHTSSQIGQGWGPFYTKSKRVRLVVLLAGVFINFVFGILAFALYYTKIGIPQPSDAPVINIVAPNSPAQNARLREGDTVYQIESLSDGPQSKRTLNTVEQLVTFVGENTGEELKLYIDRQGQQFETSIYARKPEERPENEGALGVQFVGVAYTFYPWWQMPFRGAWVGLVISLNLSFEIVKAFSNIITQVLTFSGVPNDAAGPIGIVHQASNLGIFQQGWLELLRFSGMLSINLAILNLLPIPALDGGRAFFVVSETVIGKKRREKIEGRFNLIGFAFLMGLILIISLKDVWLVLQDVFSFFTQ